MNTTRRIAIRIGLAVGFFLLLVFSPAPNAGPYGAALVGSLWAAAFAVAVTYWTGKAPVFILSVVFAFTVVAPLAILTAIASSFSRPLLESFSSVLSGMVNNGPLWGVEILIPLIFVGALLGLQKIMATT